MPVILTSQSSSAAAMQEIVKWSAGLPAWQRDALRRICQQQTLFAQDMHGLFELCREAHMPAAAASAKKAEPVTDSHIRADSAGTAVVLRAVKDAHYVNALADQQTLKFNRTGLTIVYGGNGSGKSGYARVLKKACRARAANNRVLPNVYEPDPKTPAVATVEYAVGTTSGSAKWIDGTPTDTPLSAISVFDSDCAVIHVEKTNDVAYTPAALDVLGRLAEACRSVKQKLLTEKQNLHSSVPASLVRPRCRPQTQVGKLVASISESTPFADFERLAVITEDELKRLETLRAELLLDPRKAAQQLRVRKQRLAQIIAKTEVLQLAVDDRSCDSLKDLVMNSAVRREAAQLAAEELFKDEPLEGVGSDIWRALWDAARAYSEIRAYPSSEFPVVAEDARCVLCQQDLLPEAAIRFTRFETFVKENAQKLAQDAKLAVERKQDLIRAAGFISREQTEMLSQFRVEFEIPDDIVEEVRRFFTIARWRRRQLMKRLQADAWPILPTLPASPIPGFRALETDVDGRIAELDAADSSESRKLLEREVEELEDRIWLTTALDDLRNDITRREKLAIVNAAIDDTDTTPITTKSTALAKKLVTTALRDSFAKEVDRLGVAGLRVELVQAISEYGVPKFKVSLVARPDAEVGLVLSEGEHRCIALAAFLSELATANDQSGIVFDDPVSSLDHDYREVTAKRLVDESLNRQVIVFTHDIYFLSQLAEQARKRGVTPFYQSIARGQDRTGFCSSEAPMKVRPILDALNGLERHLKNVSYAHSVGKLGDWWRHAKSIAVDLRDLWERAVEQALSPVYSRFDYKVDTKNLVKVTVLTEKDCETMRAGFGRCSKLQHSEPSAAGTPPPKPSELQSEIDELRKWMTDILKRQDAVI